MSSLQKQRSDVISNAMKGNWSEVLKVLKAYNQKREFRTSKITGTGDTLLHMAVSSGKEDVVTNMVDLLATNMVALRSGNMNIILGAENDRRNTPLHFAAKYGSVKICNKIGEIEPSLIARRNIAGETPLFLSALNGRKEAFLWLHYRYMRSVGPSSTNIVHCIRRDNDDTILHCTIEEGHIDVAIEIIHLYKDHLKELMRHNKEGLSPLHILASKRFCFKSGGLSQLSFVHYPIYWLWKVEEKNQATTLERLQKILERRKHWIGKMKEKLEGWLYCIPKMKENHTWTLQIMNELLQHASDEDMDMLSRNITDHLSISLPTQEDNENESGTITIETPLMIASRNDLVEMVEKMLELFPQRVKDVNYEGKNILLLATGSRRLKVFRFLCKQKWLSDNLFQQVDKNGNNALHLAATLAVKPDFLTPGESLSMLSEWKWFEFVKNSMPYGFLGRFNRKMEIPVITFKNSHKELLKTEGKWVAKASQACSVVSTLVVSVAFATRSIVLGRYNENSNGYTIKIFEGSSFAALFLSLISTICLLSVAVSPFQSFDSWRRAPFFLYFGVSFMFASIVCLWISFCAADFFILGDHTQKLHKSLPTYTVLSSVIILLIVTLIRLLLRPAFHSIFRTVAPNTWYSLPINYKRTEAKENST